MMRRKTYTRLGTLTLILCSVLIFCGCSVAQRSTEVWQLNSLSSVKGRKPEVTGNPKVVRATGGGKAIAFDGIDDGLLIDNNPIAGAEAFSIEVEFKPYIAFPDNIEQRFLHIQDLDNPNRRILIELRLNDRQQWYADFFMRTDSASLTLIDPTKTHPVNEWATITMVYKDGVLKGCVNGIEEVSGEIEYMPISPTAKTSVGTRMDKRSWFKGEIRSITFKQQVE